MDPRDDPSTTTTTTDYDSGDSVSVDYVYEGERCPGERRTKGASPKRKRSPRPRPRGAARCTCGAGQSRVHDDDEITDFEETSGTEEERKHQKLAAKPKSSGSATAPGCHSKERHRVDKPKATGGRNRREPSPYIEDYPDEPARPAILLREHKIMRRSSTSETKRVRPSKDGSSSSGSRGRSPSEEPPPPRPSRRFSKESPPRPRHHKRHTDVHRTHQSKSSGSEALDDFQSDSGGPDPATRHPRRECPEPATMVSRSSAGSGSRQPKYSSSWPLPAGAHLRQRRLGRHDHAYDSGEESEEERYHDESNCEEHHRPRGTRAPSFRKRNSDRERVQDRQSSPPARHERARTRPSPPRHHPRTVVSHASMTTTDNGCRSVATSLCEVWRGDTDDWESPYTSASEGDHEAGIEEPIRLLRMEDQPPRSSSPRLLPPQGDRGEFEFQALNRPFPSNPYQSYNPSTTHTEERCAGAILAPCRSPAWVYRSANRILLHDDEEQPLALTMEPDVMTDDEGNTHDLRPQSRASRWPRPGPLRGWTQPLPPRSRTALPVFSAREAREFLSPKPTRAERFDFGAWGCDRASRSSLAPGLL
ncbi:hypothetical protein MYCTH_2310964 [Thermothelomyces thermophilus ATCC 42464]|uniref:Uncharacterized protein n=1 Tax=Thermothelomyces thermophilus (strain ATCC 42464 / BCRC 31852 / DSM 1799) TaxID=573729 RepID=G2QMB8_THET4|nr:uncharacterized protein MYCTH_2310964 [Thermothelomyces thermophilus ATCC 42464]AEO61098.1 hypothetical protein MYCTH_2310964 [Thermothelomyces thermophilus ATCC 42464]